MKELDLDAPMIDQLKFLAERPRQVPWTDEQMVAVLETLSDIGDITVGKTQTLKNIERWQRATVRTPVSLADEPVNYVELLENTFKGLRPLLYKMGQKVFDAKANAWAQKSIALNRVKSELLNENFLDEVSGDFEKDIINFMGHWVNSLVWVKTRTLLTSGNVKEVCRPAHEYLGAVFCEHQKIELLVGWKVRQENIEKGLSHKTRWDAKEWERFCIHMSPYTVQSWVRGANVGEILPDVCGNIYPYMEAQSPIAGAEVGSQAMLGAVAMAPLLRDWGWAKEGLEGWSWLKADPQCAQWLLERAPLNNDSLISAIEGKVDRKWLVSKVLEEEELCLSLGRHLEKAGAPKVLEVITSIKEEQEISLALKLRDAVKGKSVDAKPSAPRI